MFRKLLVVSSLLLNTLAVFTLAVKNANADVPINSIVPGLRNSITPNPSVPNVGSKVFLPPPNFKSSDPILPGLFPKPPSARPLWNDNFLRLKQPQGVNPQDSESESEFKKPDKGVVLRRVLKK